MGVWLIHGAREAKPAASHVCELLAEKATPPSNAVGGMVGHKAAPWSCYIMTGPQAKQARDFGPAHGREVCRF